MNWELFNVGDDVSRVILELEKNLQLLNNDVIVLNFVGLYFSGMNQDIVAKEKHILEQRSLAQKLSQEYEEAEEEDKKIVFPSF